MDIRELDFDEFVLKSDRPVLVDFWASWCPPCKMMQPVIDRLSQKLVDRADVYCVNIDRCPALAARYEVSGVPTFIAFAGGQAVDRKTGALTEGQLLSLLQTAEQSMANSGNRSDESLNDASGGHNGQADGFITVVSGLPRSGTSLMMRMLEAGGMPALTDSHRTPDDDNPNGYYEFEDVKSIADNAAWLDEAAGKAVKMVYCLMKHLPSDRDYRVIFMRRNVDEILKSQKKMLERNGLVADIPDDQLRALFERELRQFYAWLPTQPHLKLINISYNDLIASPMLQIQQIGRHLQCELDIAAMAEIVDPNLYRHRAA